jgi:hypothetical protein
MRLSTPPPRRYTLARLLRMGEYRRAHLLDTLSLRRLRAWQARADEALETLEPGCSLGPNDPAYDVWCRHFNLSMAIYDAIQRRVKARRKKETTDDGLSLD